MERSRCREHRVTESVWEKLVWLVIRIGPLREVGATSIMRLAGRKTPVGAYLGLRRCTDQA